VKSVVIGGAGFIGIYVSQLLAESGRDVLIVGRDPDFGTELPKRISYLQANYNDWTALQRILEDAGELVDLAHSTVPKTSYENPAYDILSNLPFSVGLLQAASESRLRKMVYISSGGTVYGTARYLPIDESHPTQPISPYGITKLTIEKYAGMFANSAGLPVVILRPGNAYGETQQAFTGQGFIATAIQSILLDRKVDVFGPQGTVRDYLHVSDIAQAVLAALDTGMPGEIYNVGSGVGRNNLDILATIQPLSEPTGHKIDVNFLPARRFDVPANILDSQKFNNLTGWSPKVKFMDGIRRVWDVCLMNKLLEPRGS
jgi:UDP-glucose 4-epimerase